MALERSRIWRQGWRERPGREGSWPVGGERKARRRRRREKKGAQACGVHAEVVDTRALVEAEKPRLRRRRGGPEKAEATKRC